ncbi:MAG: glycosyltransferase family 39 protein [Candidatus Altiarchaeales archaeon]|nr:glycosyltransferase family 39 protein [Candidatus Altiarchaeota archaeon]MBU4342074.1 glycosyltransferase family 39 protein [Candidatus Altiarchaeota archaeon]MCG2781961.1 glycosyltransferase family 39 protein [Candidatus Altiarchaeales archaeon]
MGSKLGNILAGILPPIIAVNILAIIVYLVVTQKDIGITSTRLMEILPWFFLVNFILILILLVLNAGRFSQEFSGVSNKTWFWLIAIVILGFFMREFVVDHTHRIFFDEDLYSGIGNSIAREFRAIMCNYGTPTECREGILNKDPSGWPFLLAVFYWVFGSAEKIAFIVSVLIATVSIALVFLVVYFLSRNETAGLYASLLFALTPAHLIWSGSIATEVPFAFFSLLTILAYLLYFESHSLKAHILGAALLAYTVQIRPEGIIFIGAIALMFPLFESNLLKKLPSWKFWLPWILLFVLLTPHLMQTYSNRGGNWGAPSGEKLGWRYVDGNLTKNTLFWYSGEMHPLFFTFLAIIGAVYLLREKKNLLFNLAWFFIFFTLFVFFYAGSVDNGGIGFRFINLYCAPVAILGGYGAFMLHKILSKGLRSEKIVAILMIVLISTSFLFLSNFPYKTLVDMLGNPKPGTRHFLTNENQYPPVKGPMNLTYSRVVSFILTPDKQAQYARDMHDILVMPSMDRISNDCWVMTHNPSVFLVEGKNSLQAWYGTNDPVMNRLFNETNCVMWLEGAWCVVSPQHREGTCKNMHNKYNLTVVDSYTRPENTEQVFNLYMVNRK